MLNTLTEQKRIFNVFLALCEICYHGREERKEIIDQNASLFKLNWSTGLLSSFIGQKWIATTQIKQALKMSKANKE